MTPSTSQDELFALFDALLGGVIEPLAHRRLEERLAADATARQLYFDYLDLHMHLRQWGRVRGVESAERSGTSGQWSDSNSQSLIPNPSCIPPIVIDPAPTLHSPIGSFVFSHVAAAVILGIGLLVGLAWRISLPSSEGPSPDHNIAQVVGRITALADCHWHKTRSGVRCPGSGISEIQIPKSQNPQIPVFLGDRLVLTSGLMQIMYNSGANVILQGPCTYEIDAADGGYLAMGKLTALVEKGSGARGPGSGNTNHSPLSSLPSPLFAVRTPTAVVTDLGTEFGVEVEGSGTTRSHVFQGSVSIVPSPNGRGAMGEGKGEPADILHAGESARVERGRNRAIVITRELGQSGRFVRQIPSSSSPRPSSLGNRPLTPRYRLIDLGTLGGPTSRANAINAAGQVVGDATTVSGVQRAFLYADGKMTNLGTMSGNRSWAHDINAIGQIVGTTSDIWGDTRAFLFSDGVMTDIGTLGGSTACACAINDAGQIVGTSRTSSGVERAFLYACGKGMQDIGALGGPQTDSAATDINAGGMVAGYSNTKSGSLHVFLYSPAGGMKELATLDGNPNVAFRVNDAGQMVGLSSRRGVTHAFFYSRDLGIKDLGALNRVSTYLMDINNHGQVIGSTEGMVHGELCTYSFLYNGGKMIDLGSLVESAAGWTHLFAFAINNSGQIVGTGIAPDGNSRAFMLTPISNH